MGDVSVAADIACWAAVTWPCAEVAAAVSAASCVAEVEPSALSAATLACAVARVAWAWARFAVRVAVSMVASTVPALTRCPAITATRVTLPGTVKLTASCSAGAIVPVDVMLWRIVPVVAATRR